MNTSDRPLAARVDINGSVALAHGVPPRMGTRMGRVQLSGGGRCA